MACLYADVYVLACSSPSRYCVRVPVFARLLMSVWAQSCAGVNVFATHLKMLHFLGELGYPIVAAPCEKAHTTLMDACRPQNEGCVAASQACACNILCDCTYPCVCTHACKKTCKAASTQSLCAWTCRWTALLRATGSTSAMSTRERCGMHAGTALKFGLSTPQVMALYHN